MPAWLSRSYPFTGAGYAATGSNGGDGVAELGRVQDGTPLLATGGRDGLQTRDEAGAAPVRVPQLPVRHSTTGRKAHSAALLVGSTMGCGDACPIYPGKHYETANSPSLLARTYRRSGGSARTLTHGAARPTGLAPRRGVADAQRRARVSMKPWPY